MNHRARLLALALVVFATVACDATPRAAAVPTEAAITAQATATPFLRGTEAPITPGPLPAPVTPTLLPHMPAATSTPPATGGKYAFHINLQFDEHVTCPGSVKCDNAFVPKMVLYLRGSFGVGSNRSLAGDGTILFLNVEPCKTLLPDVSSCKVNGVSSGSFAVDGQMQGDGAQMTLRLKEMPRLAVTMTTRHPSGPINVALDNTYQEEFKRVFENAKLFDTPILTTTALSTPSSVFEGSYTFGNARTLHAFGGLFFIATNTPLPQAYAP